LPEHEKEEKGKKPPEATGGTSSTTSVGVPTSTLTSTAPISPATTPSDVVSLGATAGNQAVASALSSPAPAPKAGSGPPSLGAGQVSLPELEAYLDRATVEDVNALGAGVIRAVLHGALAQSWSLAKHTLIYGHESQPTRRALMKKLFDFRKEHWESIVKRTQSHVNGQVPEGLTKWPSAGSDSLTSDIDVNLKGKATELAVKEFNRIFKEDGWEFESGVVYDVNVYAMDFMHAFAGVDLGGGIKGTGKEGARAGHGQGGFGEVGFRNFDAGNQDVWGLVKLRLYMSEEEWSGYLESTQVPARLRNDARAKYGKYMQQMGNAMRQAQGLLAQTERTTPDSGIEQIEGTAKALIPDAGAGGSQVVVDAQRENLKMRASNRVYEDKLAEIRRRRAVLAERIREYEELMRGGGKHSTDKDAISPADLLNGRIEMDLAKLRDLVSEAAMFSNEAYVTDAAVNHTVVGLQGGNAVHQSVNELMTAVTENAADALKEIRRHSEHLWEAAYKGSKYIMRLADAAKNAGLGDIPGVESLYKAGYEISVAMKSGGTGLQRTRQSTTEEGKINEILAELRITTVSQLQAKVVELAVAIQRGAKERFTPGERHMLAQSTPAAKQALNVNA
jgi:hypothetical protein